MIMRSLQPRFAQRLMGFPHTDFRSLVQALCGIEEGITRGLWSESSPSDSNGKKPLGGQRPGDVGVISSTGLRPLNAIRQLGELLDSTTHYRLMCNIGHEHLIIHMIRPTCLRS